MNPTYVVTDIEADGPTPGKHSMLSFASVATTHEGREVGTFEAVLIPLTDSRPDADTMAWFETQPKAYAAATANPRPATDVFADFVDWVLALPGKPVFAAHPIVFDGMWIDFYLQKFTNRVLRQGPRDKAPLFYASGICIRSLAAMQLGWPIWDCQPDRYPPEWLGHYKHSHSAIDDARGYSNLLATLLAHADGRN